MGQQYPLAVIREVIHTPIPGEWGEPAESDEHETVKIIRTTNFTNEGRINYSNGVVDRVLPDKVVTAKRLKPGDIIIEKSGGSPNQPVGRVVYFDRDDETFLCNNFTAVIRVLDHGLLWPRYLHWGLYYKHQCGDTLRYQNKTTGIINLQLRKYIETETIPLPPIDTQRKIAVVLDKAQELIDLRKAQIEKLDEFLRSVFLDMFGDPVTNPKGWEVQRFSFFAEIDTRMTRDFTHYADYPHVGIENIESGTGRIINCRSVREDNIISGKYIFSNNHIIYSKIRPNLNKVALPDFNGVCSADAYPLLVTRNSTRSFLAYMLRSKHFLEYIFKQSSRTNIPKVNKAQLQSYECFAPPLPLQQQFAAIVEKTEQQKTLMQQSLTEMENNFSSLMQRAFRGELF